MQPTLGLCTGEVRRMEDVTMKLMALLLLVAAANAAAESAPALHLCLPYVEKSPVGEPTGSWLASLHPIDRIRCHQA